MSFRDKDWKDNDSFNPSLPPSPRIIYALNHSIADNLLLSANETRDASVTGQRVTSPKGHKSEGSQV